MTNIFFALAAWWEIYISERTSKKEWYIDIYIQLSFFCEYQKLNFKEARDMITIIVAVKFWQISWVVDQQNMKGHQH